MKTNKFDLGETLQTRRIAESCENDTNFCKEIIEAFTKYTACDWGNTHPDDKLLNDEAVKNNDDRIVAKYKTSKGPIFIITEWDRSYTTILFADEY